MYDFRWVGTLLIFAMGYFVGYICTKKDEEEKK